MTVYGRNRNPGRVDAVVAGDPLMLIPWRAAFWASDPGWTTRPAEGGAVADWRNGGSFGSSASQATASARPVWSQSSFAGNPGVTFDGVDDGLALASVTGLDSTTLSVVAVMRLTSVSGTKIAFGLSGGETRYAPATVSGVWFARLRGAAGGANVSGGAADTNAHLFTLIGRPSGTTLDMGIDGISVSSTTSAAAVPDVPAVQTIHLGSDGLSGKGPMVVAFFGIYAGDIGAHPNFSTFKALVASMYGLSVA